MKSTVILTAFAAMASTLGAAVSAIPVTGWNHDLVHNGSGPHAENVTGTLNTGLNQPEGYTWVEAGTYLNPSLEEQTVPGLVAGTHSSLTGNGTFTFQPFDQNNVVGLDDGETGTLLLDTPAAYSIITLYGSTADGNESATITLSFGDGTTTEFVASGTGIARDWYNTEDDRAFIAGSRASNRGEDENSALFLGTDDRIAINESYLTLSDEDQSKLLESVAITNDGGRRMGVFAISGQVVPEPSAALLSGLGLLGLLRRRRG